MAAEGYGMLIDFQYCTGCHSCEVACCKEKNIPQGQWGIKIAEIGPWQIDANPDHAKWEFDYVPVPTSQCDLCAERLEQGRKPACVVDCQALVMEVGPVEELAKRALELGPKTAIYVP